MAHCSSCGAELTGQYCNTCGARAPEERAPRKKKEAAHTAAKAHHSTKSPGLLSPQRIWRTVAMTVLALVIYGGGIFTGIYMAKGPTGSTAASGQSPAAASTGNPTLDTLSPLARANFFMEKGVALMTEGQRSAAVAEFRKSLKEWEAALQEDPNNLYALTYQGLTYYYSGDSTKALNTLRDVLEKDPNYLWAIFNLAWIYETGGKKSEAILMYKKYIAVAPTEKQNQLKYAEQFELIDRQVEAATKAVERLQGGGSGQ
ncbi:MAG: tetratricopeptide repeat protein [Bacillota bacterium]